MNSLSRTMGLFGGLGISVEASVAAARGAQDSVDKIRQLSATIKENGDEGESDQILDLFERAQDRIDLSDALGDYLEENQELVLGVVLRRAVVQERREALRSIICHANRKDQALANDLLKSGFVWVLEAFEDPHEQLGFSWYFIELKEEIGGKHVSVNVTATPTPHILDSQERIEEVASAALPKATAKKRGVFSRLKHLIIS